MVCLNTSELLVQVHVKLCGSSRVLINTHNLPGVPAKALQLSKREEANRFHSLLPVLLLLTNLLTKQTHNHL